MAATLPSYDRPPLVEVAIAARFHAADTISPAHLGAFWARMRDKFPRVNSTQPIATRNHDDPAAPWTPPALRLALSNKPDCRLQMTPADDDAWMWQVQADRLVVNWRKRGQDEYPRYSKTTEAFRQAWDQWSAFLKDVGVESLTPEAWELTYVNEIPSGPDELWSSPDQWPDVLPGLLGRRVDDETGLTLAGMHGEWVWNHQSPRAQLLVNPAPTQRGDRHVLMLALTAKGPIELPPAGEPSTNCPPDGASPFAQGLNLGHQLIVNTFDRIASERARAHWGRHGNP